MALPLTHSLDLAPRPFSQLARRSFRLGLDVRRGYVAFALAAPYYHQRRRRPALRISKTAMRHSCEWRAWRKRVLDRRPGFYALREAA